MLRRQSVLEEKNASIDCAGDPSSHTDVAGYRALNVPPAVDIEHGPGRRAVGATDPGSRHTPGLNRSTQHVRIDRRQLRGFVVPSATYDSHRIARLRGETRENVGHHPFVLLTG